MVTVIVTHQVDNFQSWKTYFDQGEEFRKQSGVKIVAIYNGVDDPNSVTIISEFSSFDVAQQFLSNPGLKSDLEKAGVKGQPEVKILNKVL